MRHTMLLSLATAALGLTAVGALPAPSLAAAPRAPLAAVPPAKAFDFKPSEMRLYRDPETGDHFWYFTYEVMNRTGKDQRFAPRIEMVTDDGAIVALGADVPSRVTRDLKKLLKDPLIEDQFSILGDLLQGEENAKTGLVVFRVPKLSATEKKVGAHVSETENLDGTEFTVYVQGLSSESKMVQHPKTGEPLRLRANLPMTFLVPGNPTAVSSASYAPKVGEWIFR